MNRIAVVAVSVVALACVWGCQSPQDRMESHMMDMSKQQMDLVRQVIGNVDRARHAGHLTFSAPLTNEILCFGNPAVAPFVAQKPFPQWRHSKCFAPEGN